MMLNFGVKRAISGEIAPDLGKTCWGCSREWSLDKPWGSLGEAYLGSVSDAKWASLI